MECFDASIESDILKVDVAQRARRGIDPQRSIDVDTIALPIGRRERQPHLVRPRAIALSDLEAVSRGEVLVEERFRVRCAERLGRPRCRS